jgi:hypothetical protein
LLCTFFSLCVSLSGFFWFFLGFFFGGEFACS